MAMPRHLILTVAWVLCGCAVGGRKETRYDYAPSSVLQSQPQTHRQITADPTGGTQSWQDITVTGRTESISPSSAPASRHSRILTKGVGDAVGKLFSGSSGPASAPVAQLVTSNEPKPAEKLVIEAWIEMQMDDVAAAAAAIRARVEADGGRVISESIIGPAKAASSAALELRVPPIKAVAFQEWLAGTGVIESRRVLASDVSKTLFDQELALKNLDLTMARLQELAKKDMPMKELLELEREMTRVRGQIEQIRGEQRWLLDRVDFATITLTLKREGGPVEFAPHARIRPGVHLASLTLLDPGGRTRSRVGGGVTIYFKRIFTVDLDVFPSQDGDTRAVIGSAGAALYSSFLGGGRRRFGNPYLGIRGGYGYLSGEQAGLVAGELGIELVKHKYLQIEAAARAVAFFRDDTTDVALQGQLGFEVPF